MEFRTVPLDAEVFVDIVVRLEKLRPMARLDGIGLDEVCVDNIEQNNVVVSSVGRYGETAGLVGEQLSVGFGDLSFCGACSGSSIVSTISGGGTACDDFVDRMPVLR